MWHQLTVFTFTQGEQYNLNSLIRSLGPIQGLLIDVIDIPEQAKDWEAIKYMEDSFIDRKTQMLLIASGHPRAVYAAQLAYRSMVPVVMVMFDFMVDSMAATHYSDVMFVNKRKDFDIIMDANKTRGATKPQVYIIGNDGGAICQYVHDFAKRKIK
jgi:hypothetical protein